MWIRVVGMWWLEGAGTGEVRRSAIKRGKPLGRGESKLKRGRTLRVRSKKTAKVYRLERIPLVKDLFADDPICVYPDCERLATDPHEIKSRARGGSITDPGNVAGLCREHHDHITTHPLEAEELGLSIHSWDEV